MINSISIRHFSAIPTENEFLMFSNVNYDVLDVTHQFGIGLGF